MSERIVFDIFTGFHPFPQDTFALGPINPRRIPHSRNIGHLGDIAASATRHRRGPRSANTEQLRDRAVRAAAAFDQFEKATPREKAAIAQQRDAQRRQQQQDELRRATNHARRYDPPTQQRGGPSIGR